MASAPISAHGSSFVTHYVLFTLSEKKCVSLSVSNLVNLPPLLLHPPILLFACFLAQFYSQLCSLSRDLFSLFHLLWFLSLFRLLFSPPFVSPYRSSVCLSRMSSLISQLHLFSLPLLSFASPLFK